MSDDLVKRMRTETNGDLGRLDAGSRWGMMIVEAAHRIEELEKKLAEEKKYFKEVNEQAWDVHSRVHQLEQQLDASNEALHAAITVKHTQEWNAHFKEVMTKTKNVLRGFK